MPPDRNLLFGILALQMDFITKDALVQAMNAWMLDKNKPLGQVLVEQGALSAGRQELLDALVEEHLAQHGHDLQQSLAAARMAAVTIPPEVDRLLSLNGKTGGDTAVPVPPASNDPFTTVDSSLGTSTSAGTRFRVVRPHARGGLGEVFVAVDEELHREVALKEIQARFADHPESRTRFVREAEITGGLEHPGIVPIYGKGEYPDRRPYYVMRFIRGQNLQAAIDRFHKTEGPGRDPGERALEFRQLLGRFVAVCNTIAYGHSRGVLHRDLKPANVMLGNYGETLVVDWGLAKVIDRPEEARTAVEPPLRISEGKDSDLTQIGAAMGTLAFMSPEQAAGRLDLIGPASDVYSLGATLYYLLTGQVPFSSSDVGVMLANVQLGEFPRPRQKNPQVPAALEAICLKAMTLKPEERYASAKALADDIEHWLADEKVTAYADPWRARLGRWVRRHKVMVGSVVVPCAAAFMVVVAWGVVVTEKVLRTEAEQQRGLVRRLLYFSRINMADRAWHENQMARMEELLQEHEHPQADKEDVRGFEWYYLWRIRHSWLLECKGHTGEIKSVVFSPDGRRLASAGGTNGKPGEIIVWDATTGKEELSLKGHTDHVNCVVFSPDGRRLASGSLDRTVKLWDARTGREIFTLQFNPPNEYGGEANSVAFSPDGRLLAGGSSLRVKLWDTSTGRETLSLKEGNCVVFSPDNLRLATTSQDGTVKVWDTTGQELLSLMGHTWHVNSLTFSPDGRRLASASPDQTVKVWHTTTGKEALTLQVKGFRTGTFSPDSRRLAGISGDNTVKVWDAISGAEVLAFKGHTGVVTSVAFSPDGRRLATASDDKTAKVWDLTTSQESLTFNGALSVAFSPDGRRLASGFGKEVKVWEGTTGQEELSLKGHTGWVRNVAFSPDGRQLASACAWQPGEVNVVKVWDLTTGQETLSLKGHTSQISSVAFSPDGRLATASWDKTVMVWDSMTGQEVFTLKGHTEPVQCVAFSPDGRRLASADRGDSSNNKPGEVKIWNAATGREAFTLSGHTDWVSSVCFSPNGRRLASASSDNTVKVWDANTGEEALTLKGHTWHVFGVVFSPDSQRLASASADGVKLWDATTGQEVFTLKFDANSVCFSPDGRRLASAGNLGIRVWDSLQPTPEIIRQREALSLVADLYPKLVRRADVLQHLRQDPHLSELLREEALARAERFLVHPENFNQGSWAVVRRPGAEAETYRQALLQAEEACRLAPGNGLFLTTLGVAQYRAGQYAKALETLTQADKLNDVGNQGSIPTDLAFLAMTQHQLGQKDKAKATLGRLRETVTKPQWAGNQEAQAFLQEAENLLQGKVAAPKK